MAKGLNGRGLKRLPEMKSELRAGYAKLSKADWADLYFDLYRQVFGETLPDETVMQDVQRRYQILKRYRQVEAGKQPTKCACGRNLKTLRAFFGDDLDGHIDTCDHCGGEVHSTEDVSECLKCGRWSAVDCEGSTSEGNSFTGERRMIKDINAERERYFNGGYAFVVGLED